MDRLNDSDICEDSAISHEPKKSGPSAFRVVQGIRKKLQEETIEEIKKNDVDGSLVALYKIHSLIPDLIKMPREEIVHLCADSVVYNEDDLVVLNKPYGLSVTEGPAQFISLKSILPALRKLLVPKSKTLFPVHRLDRCTTGLLMLAASEFRYSELKDMFARREVTKKYLCLTKMVPEPLSGSIKVPIGEKKIGGNFKMVPLLITDGKKKGKYRGCIGEARLVETNYEVIKEGMKCALVECTSQYGAKHQIRTHLGLSLGTPVIGDHKYSNYLGTQPQRLPAEVLHKLGIRASKARHLPMYLHASEIQIPDFIRGHDFHLKANIPKFFAYTIKKLHLRSLALTKSWAHKVPVMRVTVVCYLRPDCWLDRFILTGHNEWIEWQSGSQEEFLSAIETYNKCIRPIAARKGRRKMDEIVVYRSNLNGYNYRHFVSLWRNAYVVEQLLLPKLIQEESASNLWVVCKVKSPPIYLDLRGNDKIMTYMYQRLELEHASWCLSTFGGAFSAYGDYFYEFAVKAGEISTTQLRIALLLGNELLVSRCRLYYALSLIQQRKLRLAKKIIRHEYAQWNGVRHEEGKLIRNICLGTWSRLKVEKRRHG